MKYYMGNDVRTGPGGYAKVRLPGHGLVWATVQTYSPKVADWIGPAQVVILGWARSDGEGLLRWEELRALPLETRRLLATTLTAEEASELRSNHIDPETLGAASASCNRARR